MENIVNKSHATAYAVISCKTAYLLRYYPVEYWTAYLNSLLGKKDKIRQYLAIVKKQGYEVSRPDINKCSFNFTCSNDTIFMGLTSLDHVGAGMEKAITERDKNGEFKDLQDLLTRVNLGKKEVENLIKAGAFDGFGIAKRSQMLNSLEKIMNSTKIERLNKEKGQISLFDTTDDEDILNINKIQFPDIAEYSPMTIFAMEKEVSGFYLSGHPLELPEYKEVSKNSTITTMDEFTEKDNKKKVKLVGVVCIDEKTEGIKYSKKGNQYATFTLEDQFGQIKVLGFKESVEKAKSCLFNNTIVQIEGSLSVDIEEYIDNNGDVQEKRDIKIFLNDITKVTSLEDRKKVFIKIDTNNTRLMSSIKSICSKYPGYDTVVFYNPVLKKSFKYNNTIGYSFEFYNEVLNRLRIKDNDLVVTKLA